MKKSRLGGDLPLKVALFSPSPIPYKVPLYRRISAADGIDLTVIYACKMGLAPATNGYSDPVTWDRDLAGGYRMTFVKKADTNVPMTLSSAELIDTDLVPWLLRGRFDVLFSEGYSWISNQLAILTQRARGGGIVLRDSATLMHPRTLPKTLVKEVAVRAAFASVDAATYSGRENRRWLEHYGLPAERLFSCPYGPDAEYFAGEADRLGPQREVLRQEFGFGPDDGPIVLTVGRLAPVKQHKLLLEAFRRVRARHRCGLLIVGSGPLEQELHELVERQQIPGVRFSGFLNQSEVPRAYAAADAFTLLSFSETFGMVVAEAMYFGLPLVLSDKVAGAADLLGDGANGALVERDDVDGAARAIERLVSDADLRKAQGAQSRHRIMHRAALDQATEGALAAIRFAAERSRARRET